MQRAEGRKYTSANYIRIRMIRVQYDELQRKERQSSCRLSDIMSLNDFQRISLQVCLGQVSYVSEYGDFALH